ncbi:aromatic amino acid aminotransferas-like protein [Eremomyces bilateralis CBS 781.70]|uniref:Aromatic amino acid aminotransferas-like protein n=1 Tax=Eremomyces bilateralis CBS 781.70 TaxID=1392243 RepID=A0A6G1G6A4_9PEZI|nr:aromatic amino acid aminotransferas-like protein [Eremomyces bilateralis CBS 781.70]KAF1813593.1 aromatic amino acid aminotransferas-like protein [Eremomyces bilateralis CBS 781.70]
MASMSETMPLPEPKDLTHHLSRTTKNRKSSNIKKFYKFFEIPGIGQLAGGLPNPSYFPYDTFEATVAHANRWQPMDGTAAEDINPQKTTVKASRSSSDEPSILPASRLLVPRTDDADVSRKIDLTTALQYGTAEGYPALHSFIREFTREHLHSHIPYAGGPEVILTCGSTDGFSKAIQCFNNEWDGAHDPIEEKEGLLVEEYAYMNAIQTAEPRGMNVVPVAIDNEGMVAEGKGGLREVLENWDLKKGKMPHLMYTVTIGQNPTSGTLGVPRRKQLYALCQQYDIIIIEDEPYWYLQYPSSYPPDPAFSRHDARISDSRPPFLRSLVPSYLTIDTDGRVVRLDTFSKTVAPGCRLGWITAQPALVERILRITETSTQQPSGFVQSMIAELIMGPSQASSASGPRTTDHKPHSTGWFSRAQAQDSGEEKQAVGWQFDGWIRWLEGLRGEYERRMSEMCDVLSSGRHVLKHGRRLSLETSIGTEDWAVVEKVATFNFMRPLGGMFIWLRFAFETHPLFTNRGREGKFTGEKLSKALWVYWMQDPFKVLLSPGQIFAASEEVLVEDAWKCYRVCFAAIEKEEVKKISERLVKGVHKFWRIKDPKEVEGLLKEVDMADVGELGGMMSLMGMC